MNPTEDRTEDEDLRRIGHLAANLRTPGSDINRRVTPLEREVILLAVTKATTGHVSRIDVTPEGRDGVWLADRDSLKTWIKAQYFMDGIHNLNAATEPIFIGADHSVASVLADIDRADRVAVLTGDAYRGNMRHALALIMPEQPPFPQRLEVYDIGELTDADLRVSAPRP